MFSQLGITFTFRITRWTERTFTNESQWLLQKHLHNKYLRKQTSVDKLPGWLCYSLQGHFLHPYLFVSAGMTGATEQKRWHLVSTNEKWQMHKSFRLCRVEISVWHSLHCSTDENFHGSLQKTRVTGDVLKWSNLQSIIRRTKTLVWAAALFMLFFTRY